MKVLRRVVHTPTHPHTPRICPTPAAEELVYGPDEMSTLHQRHLANARRVAEKLVVSGAMTDHPAVGPRTISTARK